MKSRTSIYLIAAALVVTLAGAGCKKKPENVTPLPGMKPGQVGETPSGPIEPGATAGLGPGAVGSTIPGMTESGLPTTPIDFSSWVGDGGQTFRDQIVYFDFDKSNIKPSEVPKIEEVARRWKAEISDKALRIEGHCDERGTEEYNRALGERRALAIREYLVRLGVPAERIDTISYGEDRPVDPGHNEAAWAKNRRGEFVLLSPPGSAGSP